MPPKSVSFRQEYTASTVTMSPVLDMPTCQTPVPLTPTVAAPRGSGPDRRDPTPGPMDKRRTWA